MLQHFLDGLDAEGKSKATIETYGYNLDLFVRHCQAEKLAEIQPEHIRAYLADRSRGRAPATTHQAFRVLRTFFRWSIREGLLEFSPMDNIKAPRLEEKVINTFSPDDIRQLLTVCATLVNIYLEGEE